MSRLFIPLLLAMLCLGALPLQAQPPQPYAKSRQPDAPDYALPQNWSARPFRDDAPDLHKRDEPWISDSLKQVDVFYIYPTLYSKGKTWNADLENHRLNRRIDHYPVRLHASIFNQVGRVYAPRYRQAVLTAYTDTTASSKQAFDLAYDDLRRAFEYYMAHDNHGRPIIIASHSQGTTHSRRLLRDYFDSPSMKAQLVCAYSVGFGMFPDSYTLLTPCADAAEVNCYVTWSSFQEGYRPLPTSMLLGKVCVNPITWRQDTVPATTHGGILLNVNRKHPSTSTARIHDNYLWVKTDMPLMRHRKVLHVADYSLFYFDVRENARLRVAAYFKRYPEMQ